MVIPVRTVAIALVVIFLVIGFIVVPRYIRKDDKECKRPASGATARQRKSSTAACSQDDSFDLLAELIYTDGACSANGSARATGGFGLYVAKSAVFPAPTKVNRKMQTMEFFMDGSNSMSFPVTNIRMEGLAIVSTLALYADRLVVQALDNQPCSDVALILNQCEPFGTEKLKFAYDSQELNAEMIDDAKGVSLEIVTDSLFWMNVVQDWLPKWIRKGIAFEKKNPDILLMMFYYTEFLKQNGVPVVFTHVKSHQRGVRSAHADGNDIADGLATSAANNTTTAFERKN